MASWREETVGALEAIGGVAHLDDIYAKLRQIRTEEIPESFEAIVLSVIEKHCSDSEEYGGKFNLFYSVEGLGKEVWGLRSMKPKKLEAIDLAKRGSDAPTKVFQTASRIIRDTKLSRDLKALHGNRCQLCGESLMIRNSGYAEAHHIKPLGKPHYGPDVAENIIVLCPNHHALCDYSAIQLSRESITERGGHTIADEFIEYHNSRVSE